MDTNTFIKLVQLSDPVSNNIQIFWEKIQFPSFPQKQTKITINFKKVMLIELNN